MIFGPSRAHHQLVASDRGRLSPSSYHRRCYYIDLRNEKLAFRNLEKSTNLIGTVFDPFVIDRVIAYINGVVMRAQERRWHQSEAIQRAAVEEGDGRACAGARVEDERASETGVREERRQALAGG